MMTLPSAFDNSLRFKDLPNPSLIEREIVGYTFRNGSDFIGIRDFEHTRKPRSGTANLGWPISQPLISFCDGGLSKSVAFTYSCFHIGYRNFGGVITRTIYS